MSVAHAVQPAGVPVISVDEQFLFVPPTGNLVINRARKLLFFFEADCLHSVDGMTDFTRKLSAGDILVLPHSCRQIYRPPASETTRVHALRMVFDPEIIAPLPFPPRPENPPTSPAETASLAGWAQSHFERAVHLPLGMNAEVRETLARLRRESEDTQGNRAPGYRFRVGAACLDLMVLVARQLEENEPHSLTRARSGAFRAEQVRDFVVRHLETPLTLSQIAAHLQISPEHLARLWKSATGTTLFDFVRRARIERAKTLLTASDFNISQIASACGFSSLALFSRNFKGETGVSPGQYREKLVS